MDVTKGLLNSDVVVCYVMREFCFLTLCALFTFIYAYCVIDLFMTRYHNINGCKMAAFQAIKQTDTNFYLDADNILENGHGIEFVRGCALRL